MGEDERVGKDEWVRMKGGGWGWKGLAKDERGWWGWKESNSRLIGYFLISFWWNRFKGN